METMLRDKIKYINAFLIVEKGRYEKAYFSNSKRKFDIYISVYKKDVFRKL